MSVCVCVRVRVRACVRVRTHVCVLMRAGLLACMGGKCWCGLGRQTDTCASVCVCVLGK